MDTPTEPPTRSANEHESARPGLARTGLARLGRLCQKELREILRDRRTIVTLVLMPLMVYPILSVIFQRFLISGVTTPDTRIGLVIGLDSEPGAAILQQYLNLGHAILADSVHQATAEQDDSSAAGVVVSWPDEPYNVQWVIVEDLERDLADAKLDLGVRVVPVPVPGDGRLPLTPARFELMHQSNSAASQQALAFVERYVRAVNDRFVQQQLESLGAASVLPAQMVRRSSKITSAPSVSLATLVPLILILMTITGAVYPAIDLTAGERERGTLEALIAAPVSRLHLLLAKYVAVVTVALLTAAANLVAMTVTLFSSGLAKVVFGESELNLKTLVAVFALLVLFAAFFSAVLLAVTSFARSFKEAQAYLIPLMLLSLVPGIISLAPGVEFRGPVTVTPLVNMVLLARDVFQGTVEGGPAAAAIISTVFYAMGAVALASRIFGADAVLYGTQSGWSEWLQRPEHTRPSASLSGALLFLAVLFPIYILLASLLARLGDASLTVRLLAASLITIFLFGVLPLAVCLITRIRIVDAFHLRSAPILSFLAAGLLGVSLWPLVHELFLLHRALGLGAIRPEHVEAVRKMIESWQDISPAFLLLMMAVIPAVFEELFFRGFLFSALLNRTTARNAILVSAILFGVFHVVTSSLATERFIPSTCMGLVLGWVCLRTGSVLPGMLLHACHNGLLVTVGYYQDWLMSHRWGVEEQVHLPGYWLGFAVVGTMAGVYVLRQVALTRPTWSSLGHV